MWHARAWARGALTLMRFTAIVLLATIASLTTHDAAAQEFASAAPSGPEPGASSLIERSLPAPPEGAATARASAECTLTRWNALDDFTTRAAAIMGAWHAGRIALGISSTGDAELGWNAAAIAAGVTTSRAGAALRVIGRRDRSPPEVGAMRSTGFEVGAGFWSRIGEAFTLWMSAPGMVGAGEPPPLERGIESGVRASSGTLSAWAALIAPSSGDASMSRVAGVLCRSRTAQLWIEGRTAPLRASAGLALSRGHLRIAIQTDEHPVLGETLHVSLGTVGAVTP
jgi:hypothetical protein